MIRSGNEDNYFAEADERRGGFGVAGARERAVQIVSRPLLAIASVTQPDAAQTLAHSLREANRAIYERMLAEIDKQGMGTTASVLMLSDNRFLIGQIGDPRVYLLRDGALTQVTKDHSSVQEQGGAGGLP